MTKRIRLIGNFIVVSIFFVTLFSYAMFQGGFVSWFLFFGFLPILIYQLLFLLYPISRWEITRTLSPPVVAAGGGVVVTINIQRSFPFPLNYIVCEEVFSGTLNYIDSGNEKYNYLSESNKVYFNREVKEVVFPRFKRQFEISYELVQVPRGEHTLQSLRIKTGDLFGFIKKEHVYPVVNNLHVYPIERPMILLEQAGGYGHESVSTQLVNVKSSNVASSIREYVPGDKVSWIDWKQTARQNTMITKEFDQEKNKETLIILDHCYKEGINELAFEGAIEVTFSLLTTLRKQTIELELLSFGNKVNSFKLQDDPTRSGLIRRYLTGVQLEKGKLFPAQLKLKLYRVGNPFAVFIVTTQINEELREAIQRIKQRANQVALILIQSNPSVSENDRHVMEQLQFIGVRIHLLTERELVKDPLEVNK